VTIAVTILPILFGRSQGRNVNGLLGVRRVDRSAKCKVCRHFGFQRGVMVASRSQLGLPA